MTRRGHSGEAADDPGTNRREQLDGDHSPIRADRVANRTDDATAGTGRRGYLRKAAATALAGAGVGPGVVGTVAAADREWVGYWDSGSGGNAPDRMNVEMYKCSGTGTGVRDRAIDALKTGMNELESQAGSWFDGWSLTVYDASLSINCSNDVIDQIHGYLDDLGESEPVNYHFLHGCYGSPRWPATAWDHTGSNQAVSTYSTWNGNYSYSKVRMFHHNLHNFINMDLQDVQDLAGGDSHYQMHHSLGAVASDGISRTVMADRSAYQEEATQLGDCTGDGSTSGAVIELSECTVDALRISSQHASN